MRPTSEDDRKDGKNDKQGCSHDCRNEYCNLNCTGHWSESVEAPKHSRCPLVFVGPDYARALGVDEESPAKRPRYDSGVSPGPVSCELETGPPHHTPLCYLPSKNQTRRELEFPNGMQPTRRTRGRGEKRQPPAGQTPRTKRHVREKTIGKAMTDIERIGRTTMWWEESLSPEVARLQELNLLNVVSEVAVSTFNQATVTWSLPHRMKLLEVLGEKKPRTETCKKTMIVLEKIENRLAKELAILIPPLHREAVKKLRRKWLSLLKRCQQRLVSY